jgi:hypothetical protein
LTRLLAQEYMYVCKNCYVVDMKVSNHVYLSC